MIGVPLVFTAIAVLHAGVYRWRTGTFAGVFAPATDDELGGAR